MERKTSLLVLGAPFVLLAIVIGFVLVGLFVPVPEFILTDSTNTPSTISTLTSTSTLVPSLTPTQKLITTTPNSLSDQSTPISVTDTVTLSSTPIGTSTPISTTTSSPTSTATTVSTLTSTAVSTLDPTPTPIFTSTITPSPTPPDAVVITSTGLRLRSGPGLNYDIIDVLQQDDILNVRGRVVDNSWIQVAVDASGKLGWVFASSNLVQLYREFDEIQIVPPPATPTPSIPTSTLTPSYQFVNGPQLYEPQEYVSYTIGDPVEFSWEEYPLTNDQYYSIRIILKDAEEQDACIHVQTQEPKVTLPLNCPKGIYKWSVVVATKLPPNSEHEWRTDSMINNVREFGIGEQHPNRQNTGTGQDNPGGGCPPGDRSC